MNAIIPISNLDADISESLNGIIIEDSHRTQG